MYHREKESEVTLLEKLPGEVWTLAEKLKLRASDDGMEVCWMPRYYHNRIVITGKKWEEFIKKVLGHENFVLSFVPRNEAWPPIPIQNNPE